MFGLGWLEILLLVALCALLFGAPFLPRLARSAGRNLAALKKGIAGDGDTEPAPTEPRPPQPPR